MQSILKRSGWSAGRVGLVLLLLALVAGPAVAQVPQDTTFSGRLVDGGGTPLASPVTFELWIYDAATGGTALYAERHGPVPLDAQGNFSVLLGTGTDSGGSFPPFDAALFSDVDRHVEVVLILPTFELLTPRVPIASVPWALIARQANEIVPDPNAPRFEDCGDGTVADQQTGLLWEKKTDEVMPDVHDVDDRYSWSVGTSPWNPDGTAFTDFLARLNGDPSVVAATSGEAHGDPAFDSTVCFAHHCDWHLPAIGELRTILIGPEAAPGQATTCSGTPCIDPGFAAVGGPTESSLYWSASTLAGEPYSAWNTSFNSGLVNFNSKTLDLFVRAVRAGSCN